MPKTEKPLRIGIALQSGPGYAADTFQGVVDFSREVGNWKIEVDSDFHFGQMPTRLDSGWTGDGIIALSGENRILDGAWLKKSGIAVINATGWFDEYAGAPKIFWDDSGIASLAADHLSGLGLNHFAYIGPQQFEPSRRRGRDFQRILERAGKSCRIFEWSKKHMPDVVIRNSRDWHNGLRFIRRSLEKIELPAGILANTDITASLIIHAANEMGLRCPDDLAIMGIWNYKIVCESTRPPLTSIEIDHHRFGYQAASILHRMMTEPAFQPPDLTRSRGQKLIPRASSDYLAFSDELIATALRYLRREAVTRPVTVAEVIAQVPMSRSSFTARFKKAVGHSAKNEIIRVRLDQVKKRLRESDWTITRIAEECRFDSSQSLSRLFHRKTGKTPQQFRFSPDA